MKKYLIAPRGKSDTPLLDRLMARVEKTAECWPWQGSISTGGYGKFSYMRENKTKRSTSAHILVYELLVGKVPDGLELDHLCRNRKCVNPSHLEPVTRRENIKRGENITGENMRKTHCSKGHEFTPENTRPTSSGNRSCRACIKRNNDKRTGVNH